MIFFKKICVFIQLKILIEDVERFNSSSSSEDISRYLVLLVGHPNQFSFVEGNYVTIPGKAKKHRLIL